MKIVKIIQNTDFWKIGLMLCLLVLILFYSGYTVRTKWGSVSKENLADREMTKIKSQTNYANDMKGAMIINLCKQYEITLTEYIIDNNLNISYERIKLDVKYYKLVAIAMSDACEDITINRYIHNNDLYRYKNQNDWNIFKRNVVNIYMRKGTEVIENLYDNSKVIMPLYEWHKRAGKEIFNILEKNSNQMLEYLKIESNIFYLQSNGGE